MVMAGNELRQGVNGYVQRLQLLTSGIEDDLDAALSADDE